MLCNSSAAALQVAEPLNTCSIAARLSPRESGLGKPVSAFNGQMGCIYLFADVLSPGNSTTHVCLYICMPPGDRAHQVSVVLIGRLLASPRRLIVATLKLVQDLLCSNRSCNRSCNWSTAFTGKADGLELHLVLPADQVEAMYLLGPDYQSTFAPTESNTLLQQTPKAAALIIEGKEALGPKLLISYNAQVSMPSVCTAGSPT